MEKCAKILNKILLIKFMIPVNARCDLEKNVESGAEHNMTVERDQGLAVRLIKLNSIKFYFFVSSPERRSVPV